MNNIYIKYDNVTSPKSIVVVATTEDNECLASHLSSSFDWAKHDIGLKPCPSGCRICNDKLGIYSKRFPDGYELIDTLEEIPTMEYDSFNWMRWRGGSFHQALCEAIMRADKDNKERLRLGFPKTCAAHDMPNWDRAPDPKIYPDGAK